MSERVFEGEQRRDRIADAVVVQREQQVAVEQRLLNGAAQIVHDLGAKADPRKLARAAAFYENSTARRLGYLLEHFKHTRQAVSLRPLALKAKSFKPLDPSVRVVASLARATAPDAPAWKLSLNVPLEIDA